jgi:hypothetical protein
MTVEKLAMTVKIFPSWHKDAALPQAICYALSMLIRHEDEGAAYA